MGQDYDGKRFFMKTKTIKLNKDQTVDYIVAAVAANFPSFGGGQESAWGNPLSHILRDKPAQFAAGVDIKEVVKFIIKELE